MMRREFTFALILAVIGNLQCQENVFVNLEQLVSLHPAWQLADSINCKPKPNFLLWFPPIFSLKDSTSLALIPRAFQLAEWFEEQKRKRAGEVESLQSRQSQVSVWQIYLFPPPPPPLDPVARWKFIVQQSEKQMAERVRLNLRLFFADMLSPDEKVALERRKRELDAELEPQTVASQPIFIPISPTEKIDLTTPSPLTEPQRILDLVAQPFPLTIQTSKVQTLNISDLSLQSLINSAVSTLRSIALEAARNFAVAYAKRKGWKVTFSFQPKLPDATGEVKTAWQKWLKSLQPKE